MRWTPSGINKASKSSRCPRKRTPRPRAWPSSGGTKGRGSPRGNKPCLGEYQSGGGRASPPTPGAQTHPSPTAGVCKGVRVGVWNRCWGRGGRLQQPPWPEWGLGASRGGPVWGPAGALEEGEMPSLLLVGSRVLPLLPTSFLASSLNVPIEQGGSHCPQGHCHLLSAPTPVAALGAWQLGRGRPISSSHARGWGQPSNNSGECFSKWRILEMAKEKNSPCAEPGLAGKTQEGSSSPQLPGLPRWPWQDRGGQVPS